MAFLGKMVGMAVLNKVLNKRRAPRRQTVPNAPVAAASAGSPRAVDRVSGQAHSLVNRANSFYKAHPKLTYTVGMGAATLLLASWAKKRNLI